MGPWLLPDARFRSSGFALASNLIVAALYWLSALPALFLSDLYHGVSPIWPPSGIGLAMLYLFRGRCWPGVFVGSFLVSWQIWHGSHFSLEAQLLSALGVAASNVLECGLGVVVLRHFLGERWPLSSLFGLGVFVFGAGLLPSALGAMVGVSTLLVFDIGRAADFFERCMTWWLGDFSGVLLFSPLVFGVLELRREGVSAWRLLELASLFILLFIGSLVAFGFIEPPDWLKWAARPSLLLPFFIWAVVRFRLAGAALALVVVAALATVATVMTQMDILGLSDLQRFWGLQGFLMVMASAVYCLNAVLAERDDFGRRLAEQNANLESLVAERTARLADANRTLKQEIEERQRIAWALTASEEKMRLILEQAAEAIVLIDVGRGEIVECNRIAHERLGYAREEFLGRQLWDFESEDAPDGACAHLETVVDDSFVRFETRHRCKNGSIRDALVSVRRINLRGQDYWLATCSDITELKRSESRLAESELRHRQLLSNLQEGIWALDGNGHTSFVNARMAQMLGYTVEEMLGKHLLLFLPPHHAEQGRRFLRRRASGLREEVEMELLRRDGHVLEAYVTASSILEQDGQNTGSIFGVIDIGYRKRIEAHLRESEKRLMQVIDLVPHLIFARDARGRYLLANQALAEVFDRPVDAIIGHTLEELAISGIDRQQSLAEDLEVLSSGKPRHVAQELFVDNHDQEHIYEVTKIPFTQVGSSDTAVLGIAIDITEQRRSEQLLAGRNLIMELVARGVSLTLIFEEIVRLSESMFPDSMCSVMLVDKVQMHLRSAAAHHLPGEFLRILDGLPVGEGIGCCGNAAYCGEITIAEDVLDHPYTQSFVELAKRFELRACWSVPIRSAHGEVLGTFAGYRKTPGRPSDEQLLVMKSLGQMAAIAMDQRERELALSKLKKAMDRSGSLVLITDVERRIEYVNARLCEFSGYASEELLGNLPMMFRSPDMPDEIYENVWSELEDGEDWRGELRVQSRDGRIYWLMMSISPVFDDDGVMVNYVFVGEDVTSIKEAHNEMQQLAFHDTLTGLENRRLFKERLEHAIHVCERNHTQAAMLFIDLDNFKQINDNLGHDAGDKLLQTVAARLTACVRQEDCVARLGGDEFTVLLKEVDNELGAIKVAEKIIESLQPPVMFNDRPMHTSPSIGIALIPRDGGDSKLLMKNADLAMYQAKASGRNTYRVFRAQNQTQDDYAPSSRESILFARAQGRLRFFQKLMRNL